MVVITCCRLQKYCSGSNRSSFGSGDGVGCGIDSSYIDIGSSNAGVSGSSSLIVVVVVVVILVVVEVLLVIAKLIVFFFHVLIDSIVGVSECIIMGVPVPIDTGYNQVIVVLILRAVCSEIYSSNSFISGLFKLLRNSSGVASSLASHPREMALRTRTRVPRGSIF